MPPQIEEMEAEMHAVRQQAASAAAAARKEAAAAREARYPSPFIVLLISILA